MVLDLLDFPDGARLSSGPPARFQRFPLDEPFSVGPTGRLRIATMEAAQAWQLVLERETPRFIGGQGARLRSVEGDIFRVETGLDVTTFRVVTDETPRLDWPKPLDEAISVVAPGVAGLDVLADLLMERAHPLGERLRDLPEPQWSDEAWLGDLRHLEWEGSYDLSWGRGVVTSAVVRTLQGLDRLSAHVLSHLVQRVEVIDWTSKPSLATASAILDGLLEHRLPWLGTLTVHGLKHTVGDELQRLWRKGRWASQVTKGCVLETPRPVPLCLRTATRTDVVPERGYMQVGDGSPLCFVRYNDATVQLTVPRLNFTLNGVKRTPRVAATGPWVVVLKPKDTFTIDERTYTLDVA